MTAIAPFKTNYFPRPRDQAHACLIRTVAEVRGEALITAMTVFNNQIYFAAQNPLAVNTFPRLYSWNPQLQAAPVAVALPAALVAATNTRINGLAVYNGRLWMVTGQSATAADNGQIYAMDTTGIWTAAAVFGFPGWPGGSARANTITTAFVFQNQLVITGRHAAAGTWLTLFFYNGAAWVTEIPLTANDITTQNQFSDLSSTLYVGLAAGTVMSRSPAGVYNPNAYAFPVAGAVLGVGTINGQVWAAQGPGLTAGLTRVAPAAAAINQLARISPGVSYMLPIPSGTPVTATRGQVMLIAMWGSIMLLDPDGSLRVLVAGEGDEYVGQIQRFGNLYYLGMSSAVLATLGSAQATVRLGILE